MPHLCDKRDYNPKIRPSWWKKCEFRAHHGSQRCKQLCLFHQKKKKQLCLLIGMVKVRHDQKLKVEWLVMMFRHGIKRPLVMASGQPKWQWRATDDEWETEREVALLSLLWVALHSCTAPMEPMDPHIPSGSFVPSWSQCTIVPSRYVQVEYFFIFNLFFNFILKITHPDIYLHI